MQPLHHDKDIFVSKIPAVTLLFWIMKIAATTVGETGGDLLAQTLNVGYATSTLIFFAFFLVMVTWQLLSRRYIPVIYWAVIVATSTAGTTCQIIWTVLLASVMRRVP